MKIITSLEKYTPEKPAVVSVGNFDGVHRGHEQLIRATVAHARKSGHISMIVTFEPHTRYVTSRGKHQPLLSTFDEKAILIEKLGVETLVCLEFDEEMMRMSPEEFLVGVLKKRLGVVAEVVGETHTFGNEGVGNKNSLLSMAGKNDITLFTVPLETFQSELVSSTEIRRKIQEGQMARAMGLLGHPYLMILKRISGMKVGIQLGYPTLNFGRPSGDKKVLPLHGIYAAQLQYGSDFHNGALYYGDCPTFEGRDVHFEFHVFSFEGTMPQDGENAALWLWDYTRSDKAFETKEELVSQIKQDVLHIQDFFAGVK